MHWIPEKMEIYFGLGGLWAALLWPAICMFVKWLLILDNYA